MARYRCMICGEIYDEEIEGVRFEDLPDDWYCPVCRSPKSEFVLIEDEDIPQRTLVDEVSDTEDEVRIEIDPKLVRHDNGIIDEIRIMSYTGKGPGAPMETLIPVPDFTDILFLGAQIASKPLEDRDEVSLRTVIGRNAKQPMVLEMPVYISHMSFGALSGRAKIALSKGSATSETFGNCHAVEIKIGQGTKPGMGGHLPGEKVTDIIAMMRGKRTGEDILSPASFPEIKTPEDLRAMVDMLRSKTDGKPIGVKIAAGHIEGDLEFISGSGCDFITIDGRGGATGSSPKYLRDNSSVPTVYALARARRYMDDHGMTQELVITGGFRTGGDVMKAIAMGADAVAMASGPLIALGCQRYRACDSGRCPLGIATQDPELEMRLDVGAGAQRVANYLNAIGSELRTFARASGHSDIHDLSTDDLCTVDSEIAAHTGIRHAGL